MPPPDRATDPGAAFARLFARHHQDLFGYIFALVPNWADADDILQETGVKLWEGFGRFRPGSNFVAWACTVAHYQVLAHRRRKRGVFAPDLLDQLAADAGTVAEEADDRRDALRECVGRLPPSRRKLVELVYADGGSAPHAAEQLGRPLPSVYAGLSQVRKQLRDCVNERLGQPAGGDASELTAAVVALTAGGSPSGLASLLSQSAAARRGYAELMHDTVGLRQWAGVTAARPTFKLLGGRKPPAARWPLWAAGGGAMAAAVVLGLALPLRPAPPVAQAPAPPPAPVEPAPQPPPAVATLAAADAAEWDGPAPAAGLPAGATLALRAGTVAVRLAAGGELVVQGPADLRLGADGTPELRTGRLTATGSGLTVRTPAGDLRTDGPAEFAVLAAPAGTEAHLLTGSLTATAGGQTRTLDPLTAVALSAAGLADRPFAPGRFPAPGTLDPARPVVRDYWLLRGDTPGLARLLRHPGFVADRPDGRDFLPAFEVRPQRTPWTQFGARLVAVLTPPATGAYTFRLAADDHARLTLTDAGVRTVLCNVSRHTGFREWTRFPGQQSKPVPLVAGRRYRLEAVYDQRTQAAHLSAGWTLPDGTREDPIPAPRLARPAP